MKVEPHIETVPLRWKNPTLKKKIIPISYACYLKQWQRTLYVAGLRTDDKLRPYSLRVAAGAKLDGTVEIRIPLRNLFSNYSNRYVNSRSGELHHVSHHRGVGA